MTNNEKSEKTTYSKKGIVIDLRSDIAVDKVLYELDRNFFSE